MGPIPARNMPNGPLGPLYTRYVDIRDAVDVLADIMASGRWNEPRFRARGTVT